MAFASCQEDAHVPSDTLTSGKVDISVDETYRPVIEQQLRVFDSSYPDAHITAHYKSESDCIKDLLENKARIALVTRELNAAELKYCEQNQIAPSALAIARDAVAVIVHPSSADTALTVDNLKAILTGQYKTKYTVVVDNEGSSTVRFMTDSILRGAKMGNNIYAAKGNPAVVDYIAKNPQAIGLIGLSYISDDRDSTTGSFLSKIKVVAMQDPKSGEFNKPYQAYVALRTYPLTRHLYYINRETWTGLGSGFANFMAHERGQLIFFHSHLFPLRTNIQIREAAFN
jgi:phosphate transport system substrate-binding protein